MSRVLRTVPLALVLTAQIALSGVLLGRVYAGSLLPALVLGAAAGSVGVGVAARRLPNWLVAPLSVTALVGYAAGALWVAYRHARVEGPFAAAVVDAARNGIPRLLTALIPVEPSPDTVVVPVVVAWLAGLAGAELALRTGHTLLGFVPPALLYAGAVYVVGPNADPAVWPTLGFVALGAVGLGLTNRDPSAVPAAGGTPPAVPAALRLRTATAAVAGIAAVVGLTALVAPRVAGLVEARPADPRRYVEPPQVDSLDESPLIRISGWALNPDQRLFDIVTAGSPDATGGAPAPRSTPRIRLAVLSDYDGVTWRVGATYRGAGRVLPAVRTAPGAPVETVRQEITIADLGGRLLPAVATPESLVGTRVAYDPGTGTLIRPEGLVAGLRYTVTSARERPGLNQLPLAEVPSGEAVARFLRLGDGVPERVQRLAEQLAEDNGAPYQRALAIEQFLSEHYRLVADAPSGHGYPNLAFFLFGPSNGGGQRGTSEQFAASFAVLGRLVGLPTRVVVGFQPPAASGTVRGADAYAWPEVLFTGVGWVPFDPLPRPDTEPKPVEDDIKPKPEPSTTPPEAPTASATAPASTPGGAAAPPGGHGTTAVLVGGGAAILLLGCAVFAAVVVGGRRALRRRRLGQGPPAIRVAGAWLEVNDALRLAGQPAAAHLAATEVAAHAAGADEPPDAADRAHAVRLRPPAPVPAIDDLATLVNHAMFAPEHTGEAQARLAAEQAVTYAKALRARRPWWRRALWSLHPGPLLWHRRR